MGQGMAGKRINGGTTISGTMVLSHLAGIKIFGTGGLGMLVMSGKDSLLLSIGGVHRGGETSMDVSGKKHINTNNPSC